MAFTAPGRIGNPEMTLQTDPRTNPKLLAYLTTFGLNQNVQSEPVGADRTKVEALLAASASGMGELYDNLADSPPEGSQDAKITRSDIVIDGVDGNKVTLHSFRSAAIPLATSIPAILYTHGGGMTINETLNKVHIQWAHSLALRGLAVILVDFRNAWTATTHHPFPAGLNDVTAAARYLASHRRELGIQQLVLQGESGGGNLTLAAALKAKREGWAHEIAGVWAGVPFISGAYGWSTEERLARLPSLVEAEGYFLDRAMIMAIVEHYTPAEGDRTNPLAWPYHASTRDLEGLPPHVLSMDELDPLRDEGMAYARKLAAAGVEVAADVNLGTVHGTSVLFRRAVPEVYEKAVDSIAAFAKRL